MADQPNLLWNPLYPQQGDQDLYTHVPLWTPSPPPAPIGYFQQSLPNLPIGMQLPSWPTALPQTPDTHEAPRLQEMRKRHEHEIEQLRARHAREDQTLRIHLRMNSMNPTPPSSTTSSYSTPDTRKRSLERTLSTETTDASKKTKLAMSSAVQNSPICPTFPPSRPLGYSYQPPQTPHSWGRQPSHPPRPTQINSHPYRPILPKPQLPQALSSLSPLPSHSSTLPQINLSLTPPSVPVSETALSDACDQPDQDDDAPLPVVPRPSDMEIANLTLEQKRQAWTTMQVPQLRAVISESSAKWSQPYLRATKSACIDILINHDTPFPECPCIQWNFLLKCTYEGYDKEKFESIRSQDLKYEAQRLGIARPSRHRNELIDILLQFINNKGVGHLTAYNLTDRGCFHWKSPSVVPGKHGQRNDITVPIRPCFDITTTNPVLVIIIARDSSRHKQLVKLQKAEERQILMDQVELILRRKDVIKGIKEADYKHFDAGGCRLTHSIPISLIGVMRDNWKFDFVRSLEQASPGTKVLIVACGVDGLPADLPGWRQFYEKFQIERGLDITIVFSESSKQWHEAAMDWGEEDWRGPISDKFWAMCKLEDLINIEGDIPLARNIREQWERCRDGRHGYSQASLGQQRPVTGRNSLPRAP